MTGLAQAQSPIGWLELKPVQGQNAIQIVSHAAAFEKTAGVEFVLSVGRLNHGNTSNSRQTGRVDLAAGETKTLSAATINVEPGDALKIELKILIQGQEVSSTVMSTKTMPASQTL